MNKPESMQDQILDLIEKIVEDYDGDDAYRCSAFICLHAQDVSIEEAPSISINALEKFKHIVLEDVNAQCLNYTAFFDKDTGCAPTRQIKIWYLMLLWHQIQDGTINAEEL